MKELTRKRQDHFRFKEQKKRLIALHREDQQLWKENRQKYIDLDEPVRMGFKRNLVLVQTADMYEDHEDLMKVLALIDIEHHSATRDFRYYNYKLRKRVNLVHSPRSLNSWQWAKLERSNPELMGYFEERFVRNNWAGVPEYSYDFIAPEILVSKLSKWYVDRVPVLDSENDSRRQEIEELLNGPDGWGYKLGHHYGWRYNYRDYFLETREEIVARVAEAEMVEDYHLMWYELEDIEDEFPDYYSVMVDEYPYYYDAYLQDKRNAG